MASLNKPIDHYVILLSEHNVAEFNAILQFKPKNVHIVATDYVIKSKILERFEKAFKEHQDLAACQLHLIDNNGNFEGERVPEVAEWIENDFKQHCKNHFNGITVLNYTGATKPISQLLIQAYNWDFLDYQAFRQTGKIYIDRSSINQNHQLKFESEIESQSNIDIASYLNLYVDNIETGKNANSLIEQHPLSLEIAQLRFDGQRLKEEIDGNFFPVITPILNDLWYNYKKDNKFIKKINKNKFQCQWELFNVGSTTELQDFFIKIYSLDENLKSFNITDEYIEIPVKDDNNIAQYWVNWISGGWFEQLIYSWLIEKGFQPDKEIKTGLVPKIGKKSGNETDILLLRNDKLHVMELKSDIPVKKSPDEFRKQLNEHFQLGKFSSVLVLSSVIRDNPNINNDQKEDFLAKCKDKRIAVIWVENKEQFKQELEKLK